MVGEVAIPVVCVLGENGLDENIKGIGPISSLRNSVCLF